MDLRGYNGIQEALKAANIPASVYPEPLEGQDIRFVRIVSVSPPEEILNELHDTGFMHDSNYSSEELATAERRPALWPAGFFSGAIMLEDENTSFSIEDLTEDVELPVQADMSQEDAPQYNPDMVTWVFPAGAEDTAPKVAAITRDNFIEYAGKKYNNTRRGALLDTNLRMHVPAHYRIPSLNWLRADRLVSLMQGIEAGNVTARGVAGKVFKLLKDYCEDLYVQDQTE